MLIWPEAVALAFNVPGALGAAVQVVPPPPPVGPVTVRTPAVLVVVSPLPPVTTTEYRAPLSAAVTTGVVTAGTPVIWNGTLFFNQVYVGEPLPVVVATTEKVACWLAATVTGEGCCVITGGCCSGP